MKRHGIINSSIAMALSTLGHTDIVVICDAGLPIPQDSNRIDISLKRGCPSFLEVVEEVAKDMIIEKIVLAEEMVSHNENIHQHLLKQFAQVPTSYVSHEQFKTQLSRAKAIIRTGEVTPFANIILEAGVSF